MKNNNLYEIRKELLNGNSIYNIKLRVTFYARVSTDKYEQQNSLNNQIIYYQELINKNPNWEYIDGYIDEGISGTSTKKRDSFNRMINDSKKNIFDLIITKEISRFSRNTLDSIKYTEELLKNNIGVYFECDNINTFYPDSELRLTIMSSIAQEEVRKISERVKFGIKRSIKSGKVMGNNKIWGYTKKNGQLIIDEKEAPIIKRIFDMYVNNHIGMKKIGLILFKEGIKNNNLKPFTDSTIRSILTNPKYKGYYCGNKSQIIDYKLKKKIYLNKNDWIYYKDSKVPAIINEEIWNKANELIKNKKSKTINSNKYSLSNKIICYNDLNNYYRKTFTSSGKLNKKRVFWCCKKYLNEGINNCNNIRINENILLDILNDLINSLKINKSLIIKDLLSYYKNIDYDNKINNIKKEIINIQNKKDMLLELKLNNMINNEEFINKNNFFINNINKLENSLLEISNIDIKECIIKELNINNIEDYIYYLIDKIMVKKINKNKANLEIYLYDEKHPFYASYTYDKSRC